LFINYGGSWRSAKNIFISYGGVWRKINDAFINYGGFWQRFYNSPLEIITRVTIAQATDATTKLITLTGRNYYWSPGPPALTYKFQRSSDNSSWTDMSSGTATNPAVLSSNTYTDVINLNEYTKNSINYYRFQVNATYGTSTGSSTSLVTSFQAPTNITVTVGTITSQNEIPISWTTSTGANRYYVYYSTDNVTYTFWAGTASTSATVNGLLAGTLYYFKVRPVTGTNDTNEGYAGNDSVAVSGTTVGNTLGDFTIDSVTKGFPTGAYGTRTVSASWNSSTNAVRYEVLLQKSDDGGATWSAASQFLTSTTSRAIAYSQSAFHTNSTTTTITITGVLYSAYYRFSVRSVNSSGVTKNATNAPFEAVGTAPGVPTSLTTTPSTNSVSVGYTATTSAGSNTLTGIRYSTDNVTYSPGVEASNPFTVTGLTPSTDYTIYVKSANADNLFSTAASKAFRTTGATTISGISISNTTALPGSATSISISQTGNSGSASWTNGANTTAAGIFSVTGAGSGGTSPGNPSSLATSGTFTITSTGTATVTIRATNPPRVVATWAQANAQSYKVLYTVSGIPGTQTLNGNSSDANPQVVLATSANTVTLQSVTVYPNINQGGTGVLLASTASATGATRFTDTVGTKSVTFTATYYCSTAYFSTQIPSYQSIESSDISATVCNNYKTVCSTSSYPAYSRPGACTCTAACGAYSAYTEWSAYGEWSACTDSLQTRTRTRSRTRTCTAADCSTFTQTDTQTDTQSQACGGTTTCPQTIYGNLPGDTCQITCINGTTRTYTYDASCNCMLTSTVFNNCGAVFE
jgi:hypothetical protein